MAIIINFAGASLLKPGAYSDTQIAESSVSAPALGVIAIIGESDEGIAYGSETGVSAVSFGPDEFQIIQDKYGKGPLVDAARLAISPSNDDAIRGGAQELVLLKTNASAYASLVAQAGAGAYGTLQAKKAGAPGNNVSYACSIVSQKAIITLNRLDKGVTEISAPLGGTAVMTVQCTDSVASTVTMTVDATSFRTTVTGGTAASLNILLHSYATVAQLTAYIAAQPGYSASVANNAQGNKPTTVLDRQTAVSIKTAATIKRDLQDTTDFFAKSSLVNFTPTATSGLPSPSAKTFLSGGARGPTLQADIQNCMDALMKRRVNFVVPLFSRDATNEDAGYTDAASNWTIDSVHAAVAAHVNTASTVKGRKERQGWASYKGTYADSVEKCATLSNARVQMCVQDIKAITASTGLVGPLQPHMLSVLAAGMKCAAAVGLPNTFKQPLISGFDHIDFDPETMGDDAIASNLCFAEKTPAGAFRFVLDNSTYSQDAFAWIYNRPSVLYAADTAAYALRLNLETFVGRRNSDVSVETIKNLLIGVFDALKTAGIVVGVGYKDLSVKIAGSIVTIDVTLILVEGLEFILTGIKVQRAS